MRRFVIVVCAITLPLVACDRGGNQKTPEPAHTQGMPTISSAEGAANTTNNSEPEPQKSELSLPFQNRPFEGIITAGQPTAEQFENLKANGVKKVINLRTAEEPSPFDEDAKALREKLLYERIPVAGPADITPENAKKLAEAMKGVDGDILIHCGSSNRSGALLAMKAKYVDGLSKEEAMEIGKKAGLTSLESVVDQKLTTE